MNDSATAATAPTVHRLGPPLWGPAGAFAALTVASGVLGSAGPRIDAGTAEIAAYTAAHPTLMTVQALVMFSSAFPLVVFAVTLRARLRHLGVAVPGPTFGMAGALLAAGAIVVSALCTWSAAQPAVALEPAAAATLRTLAFATGAAGFVVPIGLMLGGFAVPVLVRGLAPRWVGWFGIVVGCLALLATFTLVAPVLDPLLPIGRFGAVIWALVVAFVLPTSRRRVRSQA